jgi:hypothetical protein
MQRPRTMPLLPSPERQPTSLRSRRPKDLISLKSKSVCSAEQMFSSAEKISAATHERSRVKKTESLVRTHGDGLACGSVIGPPNLKSVAAIHREVPTIPLEPPGNGPDVTQIKKIRQHQSKIFCKRDFAKGAPTRKSRHRSQNSTTPRTKQRHAITRLRFERLW